MGSYRSASASGGPPRLPAEMVRGHPADHGITSLYSRFGIPPGIEYRWVIDHFLPARQLRPR